MTNPNEKTETLVIPRIKRWCPNCEFFFKSFGTNCCKLITYRVEVDEAAVEWHKANTDDSSRIADDADNCPRFIPYPELLQAKWVSVNGGLSRVQEAWIGRRPPE